MKPSLVGAARPSLTATLPSAAASTLAVLATLAGQRYAMLAPGFETRYLAPLAARLHHAAGLPAAGVPAADDRRPAPGALHLTELAAGARPYMLVDGVATIPVAGLIVPDYDWAGDPWVTGCNVVRLSVQMATVDPDVRGIALLVDSGGGYVMGVPELAAWLLAQRSQPGAKPLACVVQTCAYSAAYWLAACCDSIAVRPTGGVGSIGVVMVHWDLSGLLAEWGIKATIVQSGARKTDGHSFGPLPDDVAARFQTDVDELRQLFAEGVSAGRTAAGRAVSVDAVLATEADVWDTPTRLAAAIDDGFADAMVPDWQTALAQFAAAVTPTASVRAPARAHPAARRRT